MIVSSRVCGEVVNGVCKKSGLKKTYVTSRPLEGGVSKFETGFCSNIQKQQEVCFGVLLMLLSNNKYPHNSI